MTTTFKNWGNATKDEKQVAVMLLVTRIALYTGLSIYIVSMFK